MTIIEELTHLQDKELAMKSQALLADCEATQRRVLAEILHEAEHTEYGKEHDFALISSVADFRERISLTGWNDYATYSARMKKGESNITFNGKALSFNISAGTTSPQSKYIPVSALQSQAFKLVERMRQIRYFMVEPQLMQGILLPLVNTPESEMTEAGIPAGHASGMTMQRSAIQNKMAFPISVFQITDDQERDYQIMLSAISHRNVYVIAGNNAGRMTELVRMAQQRRNDIIRDMERIDPERAKELQGMKAFTPVEYWKDLKLGLFWLSASVGKYVEELRPLLPKTTKLMDVGYGSSEAKFNIPLRPEETSGVLSTATAFYEFIPEEGGAPLMAHQTEAGKNYELVITTWGGLYRYNMKDIVRVTDFIGNTPLIEFQYKSIEVLNMVDEKLPASVVCDIIRQYFAEKGCHIRQIQIYQDVQEHCYQCYLEPLEGHIAQDAETEQAVDKLLVSQLYGYDLFRNKSHVLNMLHIHEMKQGWQQWLYQKAIRKRGLTNTQVKLSLIAKEPQEEWVLRS